MTDFASAKELNNRLKKLEAHHGGEGSVYINTKRGTVVKIFKPREVDMEKKERKIRKHIQQAKMANQKEVINPIEVVTVAEKFVGYTMSLVKDSVDLNRIAEKSFAGRNDLKDCLKLMVKVAQTVQTIHNAGMIVGDFHPGQILVVGDEIYFVDIDSWGWTGNKSYDADLKCFPHYVDPKCRDFSKRDVTLNYYSEATDYFSLAVIAFWVLTGEHPFGGVYQIDTQMSIEMRAKNRLSVLGNHEIKLMKGQTWNKWMSKELKEAFLDIFEGNKRFNIGSVLLDQLTNLQFCKQHGYYDSQTYSKCPDCSISLRSRLITPPQRHIPRDIYPDNIFLSRADVKKAYDCRTYLNKVGEVVRVNEQGDELRRVPKGIGSKRTYFLDNEKYMVVTSPRKFMNLFSSIEAYMDSGGKSAKSAKGQYKVTVFDGETIIRNFNLQGWSSLKMCGNSLYYKVYKFDKDRHLHYGLTQAIVEDGKIRELVIARKQSDFDFVVTSNGKYAMISKVQNGIEIDIEGNSIVLGPQIPLILRYDEISNLWILVSRSNKTKYNTVVLRRGKKLFETKDICYDSVNLQGSVFHRATLCLPGDGKMVSIMPYLANMPITKVITEVQSDVISKNSVLELRSISENRSELFVLSENENVYKFVM